MEKNEYIYDALREDFNKIRLLLLRPGHFDDPMTAMLYTRPHKPHNLPQYEALSYAWGSPDDVTTISIRTATFVDVNELLGADNNLTQYPNEVASVDRSVVGGYKTASEDYEHARIEVTQGLARALPYLRHKEETRVLWIDALCVNQRNLEERSAQVQRMADIYHHAKRSSFG